MPDTMHRNDVALQCTQGPWRLGYVGSSVFDGFQIHGPDGSLLFSVTQSPHASEPHASNAMVLAAAFDLLRELRQARNYVAAVANRAADRRVHDDLAQIDAAIDKAIAGATP